MKTKCQLMGIMIDFSAVDCLIIFPHHAPAAHFKAKCQGNASPGSGDCKVAYANYVHTQRTQAPALGLTLNRSASNICRRFLSLLFRSRKFVT